MQKRQTFYNHQQNIPRVLREGKHFLLHRVTDIKMCKVLPLYPNMASFYFDKRNHLSLIIYCDIKV
jgi:hypothetical protein